VWHAWGRGKVFMEFWLGGPKVRDHWEDLSVGERITLKGTLGRYGLMGRTGFGWLRSVQWRACVNTAMNLWIP
jgi:hypothetical protein